jgi:hypothetical protein
MVGWEVAVWRLVVIARVGRDLSKLVEIKKERCVGAAALL